MTRKKTLIALALFAAAAGLAAPSVANAPPYGTEQFEEWYASDGTLNGYRHWTCSGDVETWGTFSGSLSVTRRACPEPAP